ncbi:RHS repeat domain-containing protein [Terriglobus tenax]|uniref:RHS repeat domain-containing protein n=1 Tax=Terriglobus tenax TaxID=1111115 RepID=UPI0021E0F1B1|nr:RHS repeat-associated core domain-containing protein [Terriglobus tenax]
MKLFVRFAALIAVVFCLVVSNEAQTNGTGIYPFGAYDNKGFDTVNLGNLNVHFALPIVTRSGRGLNFSYVLNYEGLVWSPNGTWQPDPEWGFHGLLNGNAVAGYITYKTGTMKCPNQPDQPQATGTTTSNYVYHDPYGGAHGFKYSGRFCPNTYEEPIITGDGKAYDGSGLWISGWPEAVVHTRDGKTIYVTTSSPNATVQDSNGNTITINPNGTFTDTLGVTALTVGGGSASSPRTFTYPVTLQNGGASTATATLTYHTYTVQTNFQCSGITEYSPTTVDLPYQLVLPDSPDDKYTFAYESTPGASGNVTGRLASVTLPGGGVISYAYSGGCNGSGINDDGTPATLTRSTSSSSKIYARAHSSSSATSTTEVDDELSNHSSYAFVSTDQGLWYPTSQRVWQGGNTGATPLSEATTVYNSQSTPALLTTAVTQTDVTTKSNGGSAVLTRSAYDTNGLLSGSWQYDPANSNSLLRSTEYSYNLNTGELVANYVWDGAGNILSNTTNGYDETAAIGTSGVPQHSLLGGAPGNLTSSKVWIGGSDYITTTFTNDDAGMRRSSTLNGFSTTFGYDGTGAFATSSSSQTSGNSAVSALTTSATYDAGAAAITSSTGYNAGQTTQVLQYDALMRPTKVGTPGGGEVDYTYVPSMVRVATKLNSNDTAVQKTYLDGYGRAWRTAVKASASTWYLTDTCYDAAGQVQSVSAPYSASSDTGGSQCTSNSTNYTYDALGRTLSISRPDGSTTTNTYWSRAAKTQVNPGKGTITQYDLLGRVKEVCELTGATFPNSGSPSTCPTDIAGSGYNTHYDYDDVNHKTTISQGDRSRVFQTDAAGRTIHTEEPERGVTDYSYAYNSTGLVVTRTRPRANQSDSNVKTTTTTQYDSLGRVNSVSYDDGTPSKSFAYDESTHWGDVQLGASKGQLTFEETQGGTQFAYDVAGNVTNSITCLPDWCGNPARDVWKWYQYDLAGRMVQESWISAPTATYGYNLASQMTSINNSSFGSLYTATSMSPFGAVTSAQGNGLNTFNWFGPSGRQQAKWVCAGNPEFNCNTQMYGVGTTYIASRMDGLCDTALGQCATIAYDEFDRIVSMPGPTVSHTWSYDRYGNRVQQDGQSLSFDVHNHIQGYGYDAAGNLTNDGQRSYIYDAEGNLTEVRDAAGSTVLASYMYDALNHRVKTNEFGTVKRYGFDLSGRRSTTWQDDGSFIATQYYVGGQPYAYSDSNGLHYQHQDLVGTDRIRTSSSGAMEASFYSAPFGDGLTSSSSDTNPSHFALTDHDLAQGSGMEHATFRELSSATGRWQSPDPYDGSYSIFDPQSFNRYTYASNNPLIRIDPQGTSDYICYDQYNYVDGSYDSMDTFCGYVGSRGGLSPGGGASDGSGGAPSNPTTASHCAGVALKKNGVSLALDVASIGAGFLPGGGAVRLVGTIAVGTVATGYSAATSTSFAQGVGNFANGTLGTAASTLAILDKASAVANNFKALSALPILSYISTGISTAEDLAKTYQSYSSCMAGN